MNSFYSKIITRISTPAVIRNPVGTVCVRVPAGPSLFHGPDAADAMMAVVVHTWVD